MLLDERPADEMTAAWYGDGIIGGHSGSDPFTGDRRVGDLSPVSWPAVAAGPQRRSQRLRAGQLLGNLLKIGTNVREPARGSETGEPHPYAEVPLRRFLSV
jgi:hypothetical protein